MEDEEQQIDETKALPKGYTTPAKAMRIVSHYNSRRVRTSGGIGDKDPEQEIIDDNCSQFLKDN